MAERLSPGGSDGGRALDRSLVRFLTWWRERGAAPLDTGSRGAPTVAEYLALHPSDAPFESELEREREALLDPAAPGSNAGALKMRIGRFEVLRELGRGGQGVVYLARDPALAREVAIKVLHPHHISGEAKQRLKREADALARIEDPAIATVFECELDGPTPYMVMRFVPGRSLQDLLARARAGEATEPRLGSGLPEHVRAVVELGLRCARALERAHGAGVIHRDIKPGNLLIDAAGRPVWIDFGLARDDLASRQDLTHTGERPGTPRYMSPEQLWGAGELDPRTDVWSLGTTLFEALTLEHPFGVPSRGPQSSGLLLRSIQNRRPRSARRANPGLRDELDWILERCLEQDRDRRYPSAGALAGDLERYLNDQPVEARPPSLLYRSRKLIARHRAPAAAGLFVAGLLIGQQVMYRTRLTSSDSLLRGVQAAERRQRKAVVELVQWLSSEIDFELMNKPLQTRGPNGATRAERMLEQLRGMAVEQGALGATAESDFETRLVRAALANAEKDFELTLELLGDESSPKSPESETPETETIVLLLRAHAQRETGDLEGALVSSERLLETLDQPANIHINRGNILKDLRRYEQALESYDRGLELDPDSPWGRCQRGTLRWSAGDRTGGLEDLAEAVRQNPEDAGYRYNLAVMLGNVGRWAEAIEQLDHVAVMSPEKPLIFISRGKFRGNSRDYAGALEDFERAFELQPEGAPADWHLSRANVRLQLGHWMGALEDASAVLAVHPDHAWALEIRGIAKTWTGDRAGALEDYTASIASGQRPSTYMQRGTCLSYMDRFEEAVVDLERARVLGYRSKVLTNNLAEALHQVGRTAKAMELLEGETDPELEALRARLQGSEDSE